MHKSDEYFKNLIKYMKRTDLIYSVFISIANRQRVSNMYAPMPFLVFIKKEKERLIFVIQNYALINKCL